MTKRKYGYIITQKGAPQLTKNIGDSYTFLVPVSIQTDNNKQRETLEEVTHIFYDSDKGWVPYLSTCESDYSTLLFDSEEDAELLSDMAQALGDKAISQMFYTAECIWKAAPQNNTITDEDIL